MGKQEQYTFTLTFNDYIHTVTALQIMCEKSIEDGSGEKFINEIRDLATKFFAQYKNQLPKA